MAHVRGPFIQYDCSQCGVAVQERVHPNPERLKERIVEANTRSEKRICASCAD